MHQLEIEVLGTLYKHKKENTDSDIHKHLIKFIVL